MKTPEISAMLLSRCWIKFDNGMVIGYYMEVVKC